MVMSASKRLHQIVRQVSVAADAVGAPPTWYSGDVPTGVLEGFERYKELFTKFDAKMLPRVFHPKGHMVWFKDEADLSSLMAMDYAALERMMDRLAGGTPGGPLDGYFVGHYRVGKNILVTMLHDWNNVEHWHTNLVWVETVHGWQILSKVYTTLGKAPYPKAPTAWMQNDVLPEGISEGLQLYCKMFSNMDVSLLPKLFHSVGHMTWYLDESSPKSLISMDHKALDKMLTKSAGNNPNAPLVGEFAGHYCIGKNLVVTMLHDNDKKEKYHTILIWHKSAEGWKVLSKSFTTL